MNDIDWPSVAARMARKVDDCCGCNWASQLNSDEQAAVEAALNQQADQEVPA